MPQTPPHADSTAQEAPETTAFVLDTSGLTLVLPETTQKAIALLERCRTDGVTFSVSEYAVEIRPAARQLPADMRGDLEGCAHALRRILENEWRYFGSSEDADNARTAGDPAARRAEQLLTSA